LRPGPNASFRFRTQFQNGPLSSISTPPELLPGSAKSGVPECGYRIEKFRVLNLASSGGSQLVISRSFHAVLRERLRVAALPVPKNRHPHSYNDSRDQKERDQKHASEGTLQPNGRGSGQSEPEGK